MTEAFELLAPDILQLINQMGVDVAKLGAPDVDQ